MTVEGRRFAGVLCASTSKRASLQCHGAGCFTAGHPGVRRRESRTTTISTSTQQSSSRPNVGSNVQQRHARRYMKRTGAAGDPCEGCAVSARPHVALPDPMYGERAAKAPYALLPYAGVRVFAIDAALPFDFEHRMQQRISSENRLKVGIVGFGTFGQFLAKRLVARGHHVIATSRTSYEELARRIGVEYYNDLDDFCEEHPEVVLLASSIISTESVLRSLPVQRLKRNTLFVDVLSVKVFPKQLLLRELPPEVDILCTHPMFGPDSGKGSWTGLNFMYEKVRIGADPKREKRAELFLKFFRDEGCNMVEMTCEEHDRQAASTQFITHTVGRVLGAMELRSTEINTRGFEALLNLVNNTTNDSFELYYGLFLYNRNATDELERLEQAFDTVKKQLFGRLHDIARKQLFPEVPVAAAPPEAPQLAAPKEPLALPAAGSSSNGNGMDVSGAIRGISGRTIDV